MKKSDFLFTAIFIILAAIPILYGFHYIDKYGVNIPLDDQWETVVPWTIDYYEGNFNVGSLIQEQNDSRSFFTSIILISVSVLTKMNIKVFFFIGYSLFICAILFLIYLIIKDIKFNKRYYFLFLLPIFYYAFNPYYLFRFIYNLGSIGSLMILFAIFAIYLLDLSKNQYSRKRTYLFLILSIVLGVMCSFSGAPGLSIWFAGLLQISIQKIQDKRKKLILWIGGAAITFYFYYIALGFKINGITGTEGYRSYIFTALTYPLNKLLCFMGVLGSEVIHNSDIALFFGMLLVGVFISLIINNKGSLNLDKYSKWYALLTFGTLTALELALTRSGTIQFADFGRPDTIFYIPEIRHSLVIFLPMMCIYILALIYSKNSIDDPGEQDKKNSLVLGKMSRNMVIVGMILTLMLCGSFLHVIPGITAASQSHDKNVNNQYYLLNYGSMSDNNLNQLDIREPNAAAAANKINKFAIKLEKFKLNVFSDRSDFNLKLNLAMVEPDKKIDSAGNNLNSGYSSTSSNVQIGKSAMPAIFEYPLGQGSILEYDKFFIPKNSHLEFYIGLDESIWDKPTNDGVTFEINITNSTNRYGTTIFSQSLNPAQIPEDRIWQYHNIGLQNFSEQKVTLKLITRPNNNSDNDYPWWGNPQLITRNSV